MNALLALSLALSLAMPAEAGRKKKEAAAVAAAEAQESQAEALLVQDDAQAVAQARTLLDSAIATHPAPGPRLHAMRGMARARLGDIDGAIADTETAMAGATGDSDALVLDLALNLAIQKGMGAAPGKAPPTDADTTAALALLDKVDARIDAVLGGVPEARALVTRARIAVLSLSADRTDELVAMVDAALAAEPEAPELLAMRASLHLDAGAPRRAVELASKALAAAPDFTEARMVLASSHLAIASDLQRAAMDATDPEEIAGFEAGIATQFAAARPHLEALHDAEPRRVEYLVQLVEIAAAEGDGETMKAWQDKLDALRAGD